MCVTEVLATRQGGRHEGTHRGRDGKFADNGVMFYVGKSDSRVKFDKPGAGFTVMGECLVP
jgi:hypothetical protein